MRIAMIGTRGVPAKYGGFETAVEEVGSRLVSMGHQVVVYCRGSDQRKSYLGMERVVLPALHHPVAETLSHTGLSVAHLLKHRADVALVFNAANSPLLPVIRAARIPVAVHVDGLEWQRGKWGSWGRRYYLANERLAVRLADELIADARAIQAYYKRRYRADSAFIAYGAAVRSARSASRVSELGLTRRAYHLVVARVEPENHVDVIVDGYIRSGANWPLVVVGSVPYASEHEKRVRILAGSDARVRMIGSLWDQELLDDLYADAASYLHGHSVGGTNPSLLRAMGAGANVVAWDVDFNREVLGNSGRFFGDPDCLARRIDDVELSKDANESYGLAARATVAERYRWDDVALEYELLCKDLISGKRSLSRRRRTQSSGVGVSGE